MSPKTYKLYIIFRHVKDRNGLLANLAAVATQFIDERLTMHCGLRCIATDKSGSHDYHITTRKSNGHELMVLEEEKMQNVVDLSDGTDLSGSIASVKMSSSEMKRKARLLIDFINAERGGYNPVLMNCQHFTAMLVFLITKRNVDEEKLLHKLWGDRVSTDLLRMTTAVAFDKRLLKADEMGGSWKHYVEAKEKHHKKH